MYKINSAMLGNWNIGVAFLKIWMCFEVVLCHFINFKAYNSGFFSFFVRFSSIAVPVFMMLAFVFTDMEELVKDKNKCIKRFERLYVPNLFWAILYYVIYLIFGYLQHRSYVHGWTDFFWQLTFGHCYNRTLWFHFDLIALTILFLALFRFASKRALFISLILFYLALFFQYNSIIIGIFSKMAWPKTVLGGYFHKSYLTYSIGRFMEMLPYAVLGILCCKHHIMQRLKENANYTAILSLLTLSFLYIFNDFFKTPAGYGYQGIYRIMITIATLILFYVISLDKFPVILNSLIFEISKYTMAIYFMHRIVGFIIYNTMLRIFFDMRKGSMHDCIIIFLVSLCLAFIINKVPIKIIKMSMS